MTELVFILTDFPELAVGERAIAAPPRLPALETVLARAQREPLAPDWRAWLAAHTAATAPAGAVTVERGATAAQVATVTPAATVAAAWTAAGGEYDAAHHYWLATPVHFLAGLDRIQLHPAGLLQLSGAEQRALIEQFVQVFGESPWRLSALGGRELLLAGPPLYASGLDPARFAGEDPSAGLPRGPDAAALKRLGAELELWLHEHPSNVARSRRGELVVSTLWLWGGESVPPLLPPSPPLLAPSRPRGAPPARLFGRDTYAEALWQLQGVTAEPLPESLAQAAELLDGPADSVLLYSMRHDGGVAAALTQLEQRWLAGAVAALRRRRIEALRLVAGGCAYRLRWWDLGRLWRVRAPWWEGLTWTSK